MYISNVKNVIFFFSRFFLKKRRETDIFSGKTNFKIKKGELNLFLPFPHPLCLPLFPRNKSKKVDHLVKNVNF